MSLSTKIAYNSLAQITGKIIATLLGLFTIAIMTRYLGQTGFGQYTTIITFLSFFAVIADFGLTLVTAQMLSEPQSDQVKILNNLFSLRLVSAVILLSLAPLIVSFFPYDPLIKLGVAVAALSFVFTALNQVFVGLFQKNLTMSIASLAEVLSRLVLLGGVVYAVYTKTGLIGIIIATVISGAVSFLIHYIYASGKIRIKLQIDFSLWRKIIKKSWPLGLTIMFNLIYLRADTLILSLFKSQAEVGIYGAAYKVIDILTAMPFMFAGLILPILTAAWLGKNIERFKYLMQKSFDVMVITAMPLIAGMLLTAKPIMSFIAGSDFSLSGNILNILIIANFFIFTGCLFAHAVIALDKQKNIIPAYLFTAVTSVIGYLVFIPLYSYFGAAWVTVYSEFSIALASFYIVFKYSGFKPNWLILFKSLSASLIMASVLWLFIDRINLLLSIAMGVLIYFILLYLFGGLAKRDLLSLINK